MLNEIARQQGFFGTMAKEFSKHYFPSFSLFDNLIYKGVDWGKATINTITNAYGQFYRIQIPMFMIHPSLHQNISGIKLSGAQSKAVTEANEWIDNFYENKKVK